MQLCETQEPQNLRTPNINTESSIVLYVYQPCAGKFPELLSKTAFGILAKLKINENFAVLAKTRFV